MSSPAEESRWARAVESEGDLELQRVRLRRRQPLTPAEERETYWELQRRLAKEPKRA